MNFHSTHYDTRRRLAAEMKTRSSVILGVRQRDPERWRQFDQIYRPILSAYFHKRNLNDHDTDELIQMIYFKLLFKIDTYDPARCRFRAWLFSVAHHQFIDWIRRRKSYDDKLKNWAAHMLGELENRASESRKSSA